MSNGRSGPRGNPRAASRSAAQAPQAGPRDTVRRPVPDPTPPAVGLRRPHPSPRHAEPGHRVDPSLRFTDPRRTPAGDFAATAVANDALTRALIPGPTSSWDEVSDFCLSYDGFAYWNDLPELATRAVRTWTRHGALPATLDELRACLFYEQRRRHHFGEEPSGRSATYIRALLDGVEALLPVPAPRPSVPGVGPLADPRVRVAPEAHVRIVSAHHAETPRLRPVPAVASIRPLAPPRVRPVPAVEAHVQLVSSIEAEGRGTTVLTTDCPPDRDMGSSLSARHAQSRHPSAYRPAPHDTHPPRPGSAEFVPMPWAEPLAKPPVIARRPRPLRQVEQPAALARISVLPRPVPAPGRAPDLAAAPAPQATAFLHDDDGYRAWLAAHPEGFVLNVTRSASAASVLHRAGCSTLRAGTGTGQRATRRAPKVCGEAAALEKWSAAGGTAVAPCRHCLS